MHSFSESYEFPFLHKSAKLGTKKFLFLSLHTFMLRIAINGYGRIGRNVHRQILDMDGLEVVAINSRADATMRAHLLKYDSLHGRCKHEVTVTEDDHLMVNGHKVLILAEKEVNKLPWSDLNIDIVIEATGNKRTYETASEHIKAGAKKVIVSAPMKDITPTFVIGVNDEELKPEYDVVSNASCTTNCIAPPLKVIDEKLGLENVMVSSIHSFTGSQNLLDNSGEDLRRARSAVQSVIPTTTGSVKAVSQILPQLKGKIDGMAFRVPLATSSCADMRLVLKRDTTVEELNDILRSAASQPHLSGVLGVCDEPLVSIDFKTDPHSSIIDAQSTKVVSGKYAQVLAWYDNEWAYAKRLAELCIMVGRFI